MAAARQHSPVLGTGLVLASSLFYGSYGVWIRLMGSFFANYTQAFIRCCIVALLLAVISWRLKELEPIHWRRDAKWLGLSLVASALTSGPVYFATLRIGVGLSSATLYAGLLLSMFGFGWLFSRERYTKEKAVATLLGLTGLAFVFLPGAHHLGWVAFAAALLSGVASSLGIVVAQKMPYSASQSTMLVWGTGIVANLALVGVLRQPFPHTLVAWPWVFLLIFVVACVASSWFVVWALKIIDAGSAGVLGLLEIVFALLLGAVFFGERPRPVSLLGIACILAAAAIPYRRHLRRNKTIARTE